VNRYLNIMADALLTVRPDTWVRWFRSSLVTGEEWGSAPSEATGSLWFGVSL
jgi:hypothetical protein